MVWLQCCEGGGGGQDNGALVKQIELVVEKLKMMPDQAPTGPEPDMKVHCTCTIFPEVSEDTARVYDVDLCQYPPDQLDADNSATSTCTEPDSAARTNEEACGELQRCYRPMPKECVLGEGHFLPMNACNGDDKDAVILCQDTSETCSSKDSTICENMGGTPASCPKEVAATIPDIAR